MTNRIQAAKASKKDDICGVKCEALFPLSETNFENENLKQVLRAFMGTNQYSGRASDGLDHLTPSMRLLAYSKNPLGFITIIS